MSTLSLPKGSSLALPLFYCPIPLSLIIPAHTRYPGGGGLVIPIRHTPPLVLNIPYLTTSFSSFRSPLSLRSEEHTSELQSQSNLVCRLLLEKKKNNFSRLRKTEPGPPLNKRR